jgi:hypothetical protein
MPGPTKVKQISSTSGSDLTRKYLHQVRWFGINALAYLDYFPLMKKKKSFMTLTPALSGCPEVF